MHAKNITLHNWWWSILVCCSINENKKFFVFTLCVEIKFKDVQFKIGIMWLRAFATAAQWKIMSLNGNWIAIGDAKKEVLEMILKTRIYNEVSLWLFGNCQWHSASFQLMNILDCRSMWQDEWFSLNHEHFHPKKSH